LAGGPEDQRDESIGVLFRRLLDEGGDLVRAEINLGRQIAIHRFEKAKGGAIACMAGTMLGLAALIVLLVMIALALAPRTGPLAAGLIVAGVTALIAIVLIRYGSGRLARVMDDEDERKAPRRGDLK